VKILAFDCAGSSCSAALLADGSIAARRFATMERGQAEALMPMIDVVLGEAGCDVAALDLIAVTTGPGGFTGLRIALATARGLALASGVPLLGITCFVAIAAAVPSALRNRPLLVALESKRQELFLQILTPVEGAAALVPSQDWASWLPPGPVLVAGDGAPRFAGAIRDRDIVIAPGPGLPDAADVAVLAAQLWRKGDRPAPPMPLYLRAPDTTAPAAITQAKP
jgi:tRNA threonylcarbamoyladenosine biosynthesis protein TsaB